MPVLHIENVPEDLYRQMEAVPQRDQRSPSEAALQLLAEAVARNDEVERTRMRVVLDRIVRNRVTPPPGTPDSVEMLREDRSR